MPLGPRLPQDQHRAVEALAFEARQYVPVLVIAQSPECADGLVDRFRQRARSMLAGCNTMDLIRSLSQREYDRSPQVVRGGWAARQVRLEGRAAGEGANALGRPSEIRPRQRAPFFKEGRLGRCRVALWLAWMTRVFRRRGDAWVDLIVTAERPACACEFATGSAPPS